jgi:hypothetical protein
VFDVARNPTAVSGAINPTQDLWIGTLNGDRGLDGQLAMVQFYDRALTAENVARLAAILPLDCDASGVPDDCKPDTDGDGVPDACDLCPGTVPGSPVDADGCPPLIPGDFDRDGDVDDDDLAALAACASGPHVPHDGSEACQKADLDGDGDVDHDDFGILQRCYSGQDNPADPNCAA